jgi:hypothetical protein
MSYSRMNHSVYVQMHVWVDHGSTSYD